MIKISDIIKVHKISVEYDYYVPIDVKIGTWDEALEPTVYWRTGNLNTSLIEVGIGKYDKRIRSITLVMYDKEIKLSKKNRMIQKKGIGCPILSIDNYKECKYIDESGSLDVSIEKNNVYLLFSDNTVTSCITNERVDFYLDNEGNWLGICINDISNDDINILRSSLKGI